MLMPTADVSVVLQERRRRVMHWTGVVVFLFYCLASGWMLGVGQSDIFARLGAIGVFVGAIAFVSGLNPYVNSKVQERLNRITEQQIQDRQFSRLVEFEIIQSLLAETENVDAEQLRSCRTAAEKDYANAVALLPKIKKEHRVMEDGELQILNLAARERRMELGLISVGTLQWAFGDWLTNVVSGCGRLQC